MIRALIVGNSHAAALIKAARALPEAAARGVAFSFFATWEPIYRRLGFRGTVFGVHPLTKLPQRSIDRLTEMNGAAQIDLAAFDHVLHVGLLVPDADLIETARRFDVDGLPEAGREHRLSRPAFEALIDAQIDRPRLHAAFRGPWARLGARLTVLRRPRAKDTLFPPAEAPAAAIFGAAQDLIDARLAERAAAAGIRYLRQPAPTLTAAGLSDSRLAETAPRLLGDDSYTRPDLYHMNAQYGTLCLTAWLDSIT